MKKIELTQNYYTIVDNRDYKWLKDYNWHYSRGYAATRIMLDNKPYVFYMHRAIMGLEKWDKNQVDHIDGNGLNNRRQNLRIVTPSNNSQNRRPRKNCTSKFKGVSFSKNHRKWATGIRVLGRYIFLGYFRDEKQAALIYDKAAKKYFGEFAKTNF